MADTAIPLAGGDSIKNSLSNSWRKVVTTNIPAKPVVVGQVNSTGSVKGSLFTVTDPMLLSTASDINAGNLSVSSVSYSGSDGNLVDNNDGTYTFTPVITYIGNIILDYSISDGFYTTVGTYKYTYHQGNVAPLATAKTKNTAYETAVVITATELLVGATDANGDPITVKEVTYVGSDGTVLYNGNDTWTFTPSSSFSGDVVLSFKVTDTLLDSVSNNLTVTVAAQTANTTPTVANATPTFSITEDGSATIDLNNIFDDIEDADSALTYTFSGNTNINISIASGIATISNQTPDWNGVETVVFRATDTGSLFVEQSVDITVTPVVDITTDTYNVVFDTKTDFTVLTNDTFEGTPVVTITTPPTNGSAIVATNIIKYTPTTSYSGADTLTYTVTSGGVTEAVQIDIVVASAPNTAPTGIAKTYQTVKNSAFVITATDLLVGSADAQSDPVTVKSVDYSGADGALVDNSDGTWTFTPTTDFTGNVILGYTVTDGSLDSVSMQLTIEVLSPSFSVGSEESQSRGIIWDGTHLWVIGSVSKKAYKYTSAGVYTGISFSVVSEEIAPQDITWDGTHFWVVGSDKTHKYTAAGVYTGISFSVGSEESQSRGIIWDGSHLWVVGSGSDMVYKYTTSGVYTGISFSVGSEDGLPQGITWDGTHFWVVGYNQKTVYKYTAVGVYTGISFSVGSEESQPRGITWDGTHLWVVGSGSHKAYKYTSTGVYTGTNTAPTIANALTAFSVVEDGSDTIDLNNIFADSQDADSALTYTFSGNTNINVAVASGIATISNQVADWNGVENITFRATDTGGLFVEQVIAVTITPVVDIVTDSYNVVFDTKTDFSVLTNDTFEGTPVVTITTPPTNGSAVVNTNVIEYTPTTSYSGADTLTYTVTSGGVTEQVLVNVTVEVNPAITKISDYADNNTNPLPTLQDYVDAGVTGVDVSNLNAVNAGIDAVTGIDADTVSEIQAIATAGNLTADAAMAKITAYADNNTNPLPTLQDYVDAGVTGVTSGNLSSVNTVIDAKVSVDVDTLTELQTVVTGAMGNTAPTALAKSRSALIDAVVNITSTELLVGATDTNGDPITVKEVTYGGGDGTLVDNGDNTWDFTPTNGFSGSVVLSYVLTDTVADSSATNLTITFGAVLTGPFLWSTDLSWS